MSENVNYYLGLDMGTSSVGWAVTNSEYQLLRAKGKDLWGVRLFDEANTSAERRSYRTARRRRQREIARMGLLRELFQNAIEEKDAGFFARLDDSKYHMEDKIENNRQPFALFADTGYTDKEYYEAYPTIFHLRKELLESDMPHDIRLVYLAIANLFKRRGHFLNASLSENGEENSFADTYLELCESAEEVGLYLPKSICIQTLEQTLGEKGISRKKMAENVSALCEIKKSQKKEIQLIALLCGLVVKVKDIFGDEVVDEEHAKLAIGFRSGNYEEIELEVRSYLGDEQFEIIRLAKIIHDKALLADIMKGYEYLSQARVASYEEHKADLKLLKQVLKRYDSNAYNEMFRVMKEGNYSAYVGSVNSSENKIRRCNKGNDREELYKTIKKILSKFPQDEDVLHILQRIEADTFLPKQLTSDNGVIPNQLHTRELRAILDNAENYLSFLKEKDETGLTVSEKIIQIFKFQVPYYVGPLAPVGQEYKDKKGYNVWAERKTGKIYPWNFEEMVDLKTTAEKFIERMVRHCTYLSGEHALPKQSLLYERFQVLNELNNLKVYNQKLSIEVKQDIYKALFMQGKKVSLKKLTEYLILNGHLKELDAKTAISGIDGGFQCSLTTVGKFYPIFGELLFSDENQKMVEDIVFWGTVYGNDKKFLKEKIEENYRDVFDQQQLKRILGFKFDGWGRLSRAFLEMEGASKKDGEIRSLIQSLWETNDNLMELLSNRYTYFGTLQEEICGLEKPLKEWCIEDLDDMYLSAPVKRMVWQTLSIVKEVEEVLGNEPKRIFVEMTRSEGEKNTRTISRKQKLLDLYKSIGKEAEEWKKEIENKDEAYFRPRKLYLYYLQMGRCMYTGQSIDLEELMSANSKYDIDHIYPRHFVKDDNLDHNLVLVNKTDNARKSDTYPLDLAIQNKQKAQWQNLYKKGFITQEKYNRLTRTTPFTQEEKAGFISRQLIETAQGTKAITQIFKQAFSEDTEIVFTKASVVSDFRKKYDLLKCRLVNNYHHAHDAYLNIVAGNTYFMKFTKNPIYFIREAEKYGEKEEYKYHMEQIFDWNVIRNGEVAWKASRKGDAGTIGLVKKILAKNSPLVTKMCKEYHGGITNEVTIWSKEKARGNVSAYIPVKMKDERLQDVSKYGGFTSVAISGYSLVEYKIKGDVIRSLEAIPVYLGRIDEVNEETLVEYFTKSLQQENKKKKVEDVRICKKFIPRGSKIKYNGFHYYLGGKTGSQIWLKNAVELCLDTKHYNYVKKLEKACETQNFNESDKNKNFIITKECNEELFDIIVQKYSKSIYKNQVGVMGKLLINSVGKFEKLSKEEQGFVICQIIKNIQITDGADLCLLGEAKKSGTCKMNKKISNANEVLLISQSVTGIYKAEINLLTV